MKVGEYKGVGGLRYEFKGHVYAICDIDYGGETPEQYSRHGDGDWCGLSVVDVEAEPIMDSIYQLHTMFFHWDEKHELMHPTRVEPWDLSVGYDLEREELVHFRE